MQERARGRAPTDGGPEPLPRPTVAGIGASAGGLEALKALFDALPERPGIAFVVIVHLSAEHDSSLAEILAQHSSLPVDAVRGRLPLEADRVYVIPPGHRLVIGDGHVEAVPFSGSSLERAPIDAFFRSLAAAHGDGFAIVLSGGGSDGALGVRAIKGAGGLVLVQDPSEALFDSMPRAAIATGVADLVLPLGDLAARLGELAATKARVRAQFDRMLEQHLSAGDEAELARILAYVRARTGHDFSRYKRATVLRRVFRRMQVARAETLADYSAHLRGDEAEPRALFDDLLITVTAFFRDPDSWQALLERAVPAIFGARGTAETVRVWVPGCATGEEAYSIVMLLIEEAERRERWPEVQVFATDLDDAALAVAREGRYPAAIAADVEPARLARFFVREDDHYRVVNAVRERVLFTRHNLMRDPPFTRLDLVSCRNLLIYLNREVQQQVFEVFRYALHPGGHLFLGVAESVEGMGFEPVDGARRVYRVRGSGAAPRLPELMVSGPRLGPSVEVPAPREAAPSAPARPDVDVRLLAPPSALVDGAAHVLHLLDGAGRYLVMPDGAPTRELGSMVRPELRAGLRAALERVFAEEGTVLTPALAVGFDDGARDVALWVRARRGADGARRALVVFVEDPAAGPAGADAGDAGEGDGPVDAPGSNGGAGARTGTLERRERALHEELGRLEARLRASDEEHGAALEAVRSANEELQSVNEEYRSTAEELETSKEELQSINEELNSVNAELKHKLEEVSRAHDDLENLMAATDIGTLFLDRELCIKRFTPSLAELFNVKGGDRGRAIGDLTHRLDYDELESDARRVIGELTPVERELRHADGRSFVARVRPYRTSEHRIDGVVLSFVDVSGLRRATRAQHSSERRLEAVLQAVPDVAFAADRAGRLTYVSGRVGETTGTAPRTLLGRALWETLIHPDDRAHAEAAWMESVGSDAPYEMRFRLRAAGGGHRWVIARARRVETEARPSEDGSGDGSGDGAGNDERVGDLVGAITDVDELTRAELALREADRHRNRFLGLLGHELRNPLAALGNSLQVLEGVDGATLDAAASTSGVPIGATLEALHRQSRHMSRLVDDLLDLTRISNGKIELQPSRVDLRDSLEEHVRTMRPRVDAAGRVLEVALADGSWWIDADPERLAQVLDNLMDNAIKYSDPGDRIELAVEQDGDEALVRLRDTGIGIAPGALATLFEPFTQAAGPDQVGRDGLGLGLALVRNLVELHGGTIEAESEGPGLGSEFRLRLPLARQRSAPRGPVPAESSVDARPRRILVVDDSPDVAEPFATLLRALGHEVEVALDGPAGLKAVAARPPEVAFLDLGMPGMNGLELARRLRLDFAPDALTLVAVTGFGQAEDLAATRDAGFDEHLLKPVRMSTVRELLQRLA